ncbi:MAG: helix-turn-helix domain-containing protein [Rhodomicrobiaceae bacterium]
MVQRALARAHGKVAVAARELGISRATLHRKGRCLLSRFLAGLLMAFERRRATYADTAEVRLSPVLRWKNHFRLGETVPRSMLGAP